MKENNKWYKHLVWHGIIRKVECKDHAYAWSGNTPRTGKLKCVFCGKPKD